MTCFRVVTLFLCLTILIDSAISNYWGLWDDDFYTTSEGSLDYNDYTYFYGQESTQPTWSFYESTTTETTATEDGENEENDIYKYGITSRPSFVEGTTYTNNNIIENSSENSFPISETVENTNNSTHNEVKLLIEKLSQTVDSLTSEVNKQQTQLTELINTNIKLQEKVDFIEQQTKTNSLIFFNVPEGDRENYKTTLNKVLYVLNKVMKLKTKADDIAVALRSDSEDGATYRPILVRFTNFETKMMVLAARSRLQRSRVVIESDYSEGVARVRAQLVPFMNAAKAQGKRAFILYDRLVIDGVKYTLRELQAQDQSRQDKDVTLPGAQSQSEGDLTDELV